MAGKRVCTRIDPAIERIVLEYIAWPEVPNLLRCLLNLLADGLRRDPYLLSEVIVGGQRPKRYELRIYKREEEVDDLK